eukprot:SAG31_NODE_756_length_12303_cov_8.918142_1_plen_693_part_00
MYTQMPRDGRRLQNLAAQLHIDAARCRWATTCLAAAGDPENQLKAPMASGCCEDGDSSLEPILQPEALAFYKENGFLVVPNVIPEALCTAVIDEIDSFFDAAPVGCPVGGWTESAALWNVRQHPRLHKVFAALYGSEQLWVSQDGWDMKPPFSSRDTDADPLGKALRFEGGGIWFGPRHPENRLGALHFDLTRRDDFEAMLAGDLGGPGWRPTYPQAVLYLNDRTAAGGGLRLVPGFHQEVRAWLDKIPQDLTDDEFEQRRFIGRHDEALAERLNQRAINIPAQAGSLVIWHRLIPHCNGRNLESDSRYAQYVTMGKPPTDPVEYSTAAARRIAEWEELRNDLTDERIERSIGTDFCRRWERRRPPLPPLTSLGRRLLGLEMWPAAQKSESKGSASPKPMLSIQALSWHYLDGTGQPPPQAVDEVLAWVATQPLVGRLDLEDRLLAAVNGGLKSMVSDQTPVLKQLAEDFQSSGVCLGYIGLTVDFIGPLSASSIEAELARCYALIDVAAILGCGLVRVPGNAVQSELPFAEAWRLIRSKFERAVAYGRGKGVAIGLHNHAGGGTAIPATAKGLLAMLDQVPGLQLILDVGNGNFTGCPELVSKGEKAPETLYQEIAACVSAATVVRLKFVDCESGTEKFVDYARIFNMLREAARLQWLSIVYYDTVAGLRASDALPLCISEVDRWRQHYDI